MVANLAFEGMRQAKIWGGKQLLHNRPQEARLFL